MLNRKVSLIIPVYNTVKYLRRCLESAVSQTYENMEIICVDDGSTDGSEKIVDEFATRDGRVIAVHQENRGESNARNTGLRIASGDYIGFMDCDDWIEPDMYECLVRELEEAGADMAIAGFYQEFANDDQVNQSIAVQNEKTVDSKVFDGRQLLRYIYERNSYRAFAYMWNKLYKREIVCNDQSELFFFDESMKLGGRCFVSGTVCSQRKMCCLCGQEFLSLPAAFGFRLSQSGFDEKAGSYTGIPNCFGRV